MKRMVFVFVALACRISVLGTDAVPPFPEVGAARAITQGPHDHLLANYFAINAWSADLRYVAALETALNGRLPEANERCTLGLIDTWEGDRFIPVTTTACWNFQEATMFHWLPKEPDTFVFNDFREGKFVAVVMNWKTKAERVLPHPVSAVTRDGTKAVCLNYARLYLTRPDYGYAGDGQDAREKVEWPEDDGLWLMDMKTGATKLILSVAQGRSQMPATKVVPGKPGNPLAYYCHTVFNPSGTRIFFLARSVDWYDKTTHKIPAWNTTSFTVKVDGSDLRRCFPDGWGGSHFNWLDDETMVVTVWPKFLQNKSWHVRFTVGDEKQVKRLAPGLLDWDGHCVYSPDGTWMSTEGYFDGTFLRNWALMRTADEAVLPVGSFFVPEQYRGGYWRCDLHARWRPDGRQLAFTSVHEGTRQIYVRDVGAARTDVSLAGTDWTADGVAVSVPHTWNAEDAADGKGDPAEWKAHYSSGATTYLRKSVTYRRALPDPTPGRRQFVKCLGASMKATVKVNGTTLGSHVGAFMAFGFEATAALKPTGNVLEVIVDNTFDPDVQPINADFSVYGGLYRDVRWIETDRVCIDPVTDGAGGAEVTADPATGNVVVRVRVLGGTNEVQHVHFEKPELWSPENPKLYTINVEVRQQGGRDCLPVTFGFRTAEFRADGFYLNGVKRKIRGVCRHQDREGKGWAIDPRDDEEDVRLIKAMGADGVRTSHYPQSPSFYAACDRLGLLVWTEVPNVNGLTFTDQARENEWREAREMVAQHRNHPSIIAWGIFNEIYNAKMEAAPEPRLAALRDYVHTLDASRPVTGASNGSDEKRRTLNALPDQLGFNLYPGWYGSASDKMGATLDKSFAECGRTTAAVTEYGGGGCVTQHADPLAFRPQPKGLDHPEEYQAYHHVENYRAILKDKRLWGSFAWVMFDLGSDARSEGAYMGRNDKGLVTWDRKTFKDAYYFYRANWTATPTLRLVGTRMTTVSNAAVTVIGFSNVGAVTLTVNDKKIGTQMPDAVKSVRWNDLPLMLGPNRIKLEASGYVETAVWTR